MASSAAVHEDGSWLSRIDRSLYRLETGLALLSGIAIFSLMVLAVTSVSGRFLLNQPLPGYVDWIEQVMPLIALMGIAYTQRNGGHIRMDLLVGHLHGRVLWLFEWLTTIAILALIVLLVWGSWAHFSRSFDWQAPLWSRDSSIDIGIPIWPAKLLIPTALAVLSLRLLLQLWGFAKAFIQNQEYPVAVPLVQDIATQAKAEAKLVEQTDTSGGAT
ncbi:MAG: TRAP transporter small permease [Gammaproteobacteria bacterium]|jgi:TRAP-type C4-dicarboxylate transport system permease small subunit|nr:TRAP transporter small permease [Gammaproteobacteria bacterium]